MRHARLLVFIDGSPSSKRAVGHVARALRGRRGPRVCLAHAFPPIPPRLCEFGGAETPEEEERQEARLKEAQQRWMAVTKETAQRVFDGTRARLRKAGLAAGAIETQFLEAADGRDICGEILEAARARRCSTVVVGREPVSWLRELMRDDLAEEIVRRGKGLTIWVVE